MMKKKIHKAYFDYLREEDWLNEMAAKGLALVDYTFVTYTFEDTRPGEYIYRIELLDSRAAHPAVKSYLEFLEDSGVEVVATYTWWVFLRKPAENGPFEIYSDNASRITQLQKVSRRFTIFGFFMLLISLISIILALWPGNNPPFSTMNISAGLGGLANCLLLFTMNSRYRRNLKRLQKEGIIRES